MPAVAITNVMPIASTPTTLAWVSMLRTLSQVGKVSGSRIAPATNSSTTTIASAYSWNSSSSAGRSAIGRHTTSSARSGESVGATAWRRSSRSLAVFPSTSATISPSRITRMREQMPTSSSSSDETTRTPTPGLRQVADDSVELRLGRHVHAARRLVEQEHAAAAQEPAREHDLLLVSARQQAHDAIRIVGHGVQHAQLLARLLALLADADAAGGRSAAARRGSRSWPSSSRGRAPGTCGPRARAPAPRRSRRAGRAGSRFPSSQTSPSSGRSSP